MKRRLLEQFDMIKLSIKSIESSRSTKELRRNQMLVKVWNNTFKFLIDQSKSEYEKSIYRAYYGMLNDSTAQSLTWDEMKKLVALIMKGGVLL